MSSSAPKMISLFCEDLKAIKDFECCAGCHEAETVGRMDFQIHQCKVDDHAVFVHGCCRASVCRMTADQNIDLRPAINHRREFIERISKEVQA